MDPKSFRRHLRKASTSSEVQMWNVLRNRKFHGLKFRRQHTLGHFTVDFYCEEIKLVIEIDGSIHHNLGQANYDDERDRLLKHMGYGVYRVDNEAVLRFMDTVLEDLGIFLGIG